MKFQVDKAALAQVLQKVQNITEKKTNMPILSNTLIDASEGQVLHFSATDLELSIRTQMAAQIFATGSRTVTARKLLEVVRELPGESVGIELLPNDRLSIRAGRSHFELATIPAEDFPHLNLNEEIDFVPCDAAALRSALDKTLYAVPVEEDPFSIAGLFCHPVDSGDLRFVASDGHRLAFSQISKDLLKGLDVGDGIIIPRKGVQEILRLSEKESEVLLGIRENSLLVKTTDTLLSVQLLEAEFPEYQVIIPEERPCAIELEWDAFHSALKRMAILTNQKWRHVRFVVRSGELELEAGDPELGKATDSLEIDYSGSDFNIAFNIRYVLDAIQAVESPQVRFEWVDEFHGGVFLGTQDTGSLTLIMPMVV